jgi:1-aminocyclopropane-1-carboxylate deaminase
VNSLAYQDTPVVTWKDKSLLVQIIVKLECANHPNVSGNKWWKLKHNLGAAAKTRLPVLTFGGPFSNHIFATAAATNQVGLRSIGVIRGERVDNSTLGFAASQGMQLEFIPRETYRHKSEDSFVDELRQRYGDFYLIPEGGTNDLAIRGCCEWGEMLNRDIKFDTLCLPVGTGGTMAGLITAMKPAQKVLGFSSLKGGEFLENEVRRWLPSTTCEWTIETNYHFGGYAKTDQQLLRFIEETRITQGIALDPVYTSKMMFGVVDLARRGAFNEGSTVLVLHTGGLQGRPCQVTT